MTAAALAAATVPAAATPRDPVDATLHDLVAQGFPGAVADVRDGQRVRRYVAGVADTRTGEPARHWQRFRIASNTKAFVATVVLRLAGEGVLSLDDDVERWLPGLVRGPGYDATGNGVVAEIDRRILTPLGLRDTYFPVTDPYLRGPHLHGYDRTGQDLSVFSPSYDWTAGAMVSTVDDLAKFHRALFDGELLAPAQQREPLAAVPVNERQAYGLGVERLTLPCPGGDRELWGNTGAGPGYYSLSFTSGERQLVTVLTAYDLGAELRGEQPWPAGPIPVLMTTFCGTT
ncbi:beta-lactamase family protein [Amycolatopsis sp. K13G38]|uniref:Beta-lactamase family protein n=1 Tax=Amycolatopsis acididurans TaxID=2724524 RepID=A0ABX1J0V0_9PSEU|nr:beta-lactamase family protein [Amycolatopsis acididurans]